MTRPLALITGASAGIGAALARIFAANGYDVALTARREDRLNGLAEEIRLKYQVETLVVPADLSKPGACADILGEIGNQGRHVDALANNAGYGLPGMFAETTWEDQSTFLMVMVNAVCELSHKVLPGMVERKFGRILNVASLAGLTPGGPGHTPCTGPRKASW
jgi:short-subunit dehydrogenase